MWRAAALAGDRSEVAEAADDRQPVGEGHVVDQPDRCEPIFGVLDECAVELDADAAGPDDQRRLSQRGSTARPADGGVGDGASHGHAAKGEGPLQDQVAGHRPHQAGEAERQQSDAAHRADGRHFVERRGRERVAVAPPGGEPQRDQGAIGGHRPARTGDQAGDGDGHDVEDRPQAPQQVGFGPGTRVDGDHFERDDRTTVGPGIGDAEFKDGHGLQPPASARRPAQYAAMRHERAAGGTSTPG